MDELLGLALIIYIVASALLGMLRREQARTRPRHPEETEGDAPSGPWRDWEEELRDLFERSRERQQAEGEPGEPEPAPAEAGDDRPWLEVEPIPLPDEWSVEEAPWPRYDEPTGKEPVPEPQAGPLPPPVPPAPPRPTAPSLPGRAPTGSSDGMEVGAGAPWYRPPSGALPEGPPVPAPTSVRSPAPASARPDGAASHPEHRDETLARRIRRRLRGGRDPLREAVILMEVLGPPRVLRPYRPPWVNR